VAGSSALIAITTKMGLVGRVPHSRLHHGNTTSLRLIVLLADVQRTK
jgi:hypothetical protein